MAKLTRAQAEAHAAAVAILAQDALSEDDKEFAYRNWNEGANHVNGAAGAFFTPFDMAFDFAIDAGGGRIIDLCAGIGMLSYAIWQRSRFYDRRPQITCVERNADYIEVGKRLLPGGQTLGWIGQQDGHIGRAAEMAGKALVFRGLTVIDSFLGSRKFVADNDNYLIEHRKSA